MLNWLDVATLWGVVVSGENDSVYRFGVFEFDSQTAELRKSGIKLKLQEQQRQVLVRLLDRRNCRPGRITLTPLVQRYVRRF
jgi:hypothetical protein